MKRILSLQLLEVREDTSLHALSTVSNFCKTKSTASWFACVVPPPTNQGG